MESMAEKETPETNSEQEGRAAGKPSKEVKDPVCSMTVDPKTAEKSVYKGNTYYAARQENF